MNDQQKAYLAGKAKRYMPGNMDSVEALGVLAERIGAVVPSVQVCAARAEREVFPQVRSKRFTMQDAVRKCGRDVNVVLGITPLDKLDLSKVPTQTLLQVWGAADFYSSRLPGDITQNLRALQEKAGQEILRRDPMPMPKTMPVIDPIPAVNVPPAAPAGKQAAPVKSDPIPDTDFSDGKRKRGGAWGGKLGIVAVAVFVAFALLFNDVTRVEKAIDKIGVVTMESREIIEEVEDMYEDLSDTRKGKVGNYEVLQAARAEYNRLVAAINRAIDAIDAIGTVDLGSEKRILTAREAYDALAKDNLTEYAVHKLPVLETAEQIFAEIDSQDLFDTAMKLFSERKFDQALPKYEEFVRKYPNHPQYKVCKEGARDCMIQLVELKFQENKIEECVKDTQQIKAKYGESEPYKKLWKKIEARLEATRPATGNVLVDNIGVRQGVFEVKAGNKDACIKLIDPEDETRYKMFYVRAGEVGQVGMPDGDFIAHYATGQYWYGAETMFGEGTLLTKSDAVFTFGTSITEGNVVYCNKISITLYVVPDGNLEVESIDKEEF